MKPFWIPYAVDVFVERTKDCDVLNKLETNEDVKANVLGISVLNVEAYNVLT